MITSGFSAIHSRLDMVNSYSKMICSKAMLVYQRAINPVQDHSMNTYKWSRGCNHRKESPIQWRESSLVNRRWHSTSWMWSDPVCLRLFSLSMLLSCLVHLEAPVSSALNCPFLKGVLQNCFVFDFVNFQNWGTLAELLHFWCCQVQKLRKSRRIQA